MPRPCRKRRICAEPACRSFGPRRRNGITAESGAGAESGARPEVKTGHCGMEADGEMRQTITMTLDEFEAIRWIDLEGLTQEQCAEQMDVARTTAQAIYSSARAKIAECLVNEKELIIEGGNYVICDRDAGGCRRGCHGGRGCHRHCKRDVPEERCRKEKYQEEEKNEDCSNL